MKNVHPTGSPRGPPAFYEDNMKHILCCSFGKDSLATALLALQHDEPLDELVYCEVMFDSGLSAEPPEHARFIAQVAIPYFEQRGIPTRILRSKNTYLSCFYRIVTRGQLQGKYSGFPLSNRCKILRDCKLQPVREYIKTLPPDTVQYLGIALMSRIVWSGYSPIRFHSWRNTMSPSRMPAEWWRRQDFFRPYTGSPTGAVVGSAPTPL